MYKLGSTACCAPSSIFPPHGHRFQSRSRSRSRSHAVQATLYISTRPVCSAEASHELPRRHRHAARRSSRRVFSLSSSPSSIRDRQACRRMDTLFLGAYKFFRAWFNVSYIARAISVDRNSSRRIDRCRDDPCTLLLKLHRSL